MEEPKPYDPTKEYFVGDRVTYPVVEAFSAGNDIEPWVCVCIKHHMPNSGNAPQGFYSPWPNEYGWDERWYGDGYDRNYHTTFLGEYWEPIPPEWSASKTYYNNAIRLYKGRIYQTTWRYNQRWVSDGTLEESGQLTEGGYREDRTPTLLPPSQDIDEDGVRTWTLRSQAQYTTAPFNFSPYNFERDYVEEKKLKVGLSPYSYFQNRSEDGFHNGGWRVGMNNYGSNMDGASLEVYLDYEPIQLDDDDNYYKGILDMAGGDTAASKCGFAFQSPYIGTIRHQATITSFNREAYPPDIRYSEPAANGGSTASPDYDEGPPVVGSPPGPPLPSWMGRARIYAGHNHPLYHKRSIEVKALILSRRSWWVKFQPPTIPGSPVVPPTYNRRTKNTTSIKSSTNQFVIGCYTRYPTFVLIVDSKEYDPILYTEIGNYTLSAGPDSSKSILIRTIYRVLE